MAQRETASAVEQAARADAQTQEVRADGLRREEAAVTRHATVEAQRDEARAQAASANQALAVSQAEVRMGEEALKRMKEQFESERGTLRELIESAQGRHEELQARGHAESLERERAEAAAMAAQNEKRLLQELSSQVQQQLLDERKAARHAAQVAEAERLELHARIEEVLREMAQVKARLGSYEIELPNAAQRHHQAEAQLGAALQEAANKEMDRRELFEACQRLEAELADEKQANAALRDEKGRAAVLSAQRDTAEAAGVRVQEQLTAALERLQTSEERRRVSEESLREVRSQLELSAQWEARCREMERERNRAVEQLHSAQSEAKAIGEREQVLLQRIALREKLVHVDWSRGSDVLQELRHVTGAAGPVSGGLTRSLGAPSPGLLAGGYHVYGSPPKVSTASRSPG